jgi:hypothetical protein
VNKLRELFLIGGVHDIDLDVLEHLLELRDLFLEVLLKLLVGGKLEGVLLLPAATASCDFVEPRNGFLRFFLDFYFV